MKLKFKIQPYQTAAVVAVVDCFEGQPKNDPAASHYRIDPGRVARLQTAPMEQTGFRNADLTLDGAELLANVQRVQKGQNLPLSSGLAASSAAPINLDVEMETGTGKTYVYIKTMFELHQRYGWGKFIVVVPSIAIREGVAKTFAVTAEHFQESYGRKARWFVYNSRNLQELEAFSSGTGVNVMIVNVQAFNARGKDARRIYMELDDFQSRRPIDVIAANRPILILDEPQKMGGAKTQDGLEAFNALFALYYSATHKVTHDKVHRLDAVDAYNQKLVKRIAVRGITVTGLTGTNGYLYLQDVRVYPNKAPDARVELEVRGKTAVARKLHTLRKGDNLFDRSQGLTQYQTGYVVSDIDARDNSIHFVNGLVLHAGEATGDVNEDVLRRIQIRETIHAHLERERTLFAQGVKVLSLFFIDTVAKYRDYAREDTKGPYARVFEEEYAAALDELHGELSLSKSDAAWLAWLDDMAPQAVHQGYFAIDGKTRQLVDPKVFARGEQAGESDDESAYDLILKDKERLLSRDEPVRFLFSHSALREGWDNPNVFQICTLKHSDNTVSRRQEVGRGLRICVNQDGDRMDAPETVHAINVLTVIANESYKDFVAGLQKDISDGLSDRPRAASVAYFTGRVIKADGSDVTMTDAMARHLYQYLVKNDFVDADDHITEAYHAAKDGDALPELPPDLQDHAPAVFGLVDSVFSAAQIHVEDDHAAKINRLNANFERKEFQALWSRINHKAAYTVHFDSDELIRKCVAALNKELRARPLRYTVVRGQQAAQLDVDLIKSGDGFKAEESTPQKYVGSVHSAVRYDLIGELATGALLTRKTIATILAGLEEPVFAQFATNPESFLSEAIRIITEQKATTVVEHLAYDVLESTWDTDVFTAAQTKLDPANSVGPLQKHVYDYVPTQSKGEQAFAHDLDIAGEVVVYAKLPSGFAIPTPVGNYNPDWAVAFTAGAVKHVYFVAETKGSMSTMQLKAIEDAKIRCARKLFAEFSQRVSEDKVVYDVVDSFAKLRTLVTA